jgi:DNA polymerase-3 subunit delta
VLADVRAGRLGPVYVIYGRDESEKAGLVSAFVEHLDVELRAFNLERLYGGDEGAGAALIDSARTLPLMAARRIVLVLQADRLFAPKREGEEAQRTMESLEDYVSAPEPHATVVFVADSFDRRRRVARALQQHGVVVECGGVTSEEDGRQWIREQAATEGVSFEPSAVAFLARRDWNDVARLRADFDRVVLYAAGERIITLAHVTDTIGAEMLQEQFAIADAIANKDVGRALRELVLILNEGQPAYMLLGQLRWVVESRMTGPHVKSAIEAVLRTDMALKTSAGDHRVLLERLVVELCDERLRARPRLPGLPF